MEGSDDILSKVKKGATIIIALSGGPDSVYLLYLFKKLEKKHDLKLIAAHLNHGTRPTSKRDELFCQNLCKKLKIPFKCKKMQLKGVKNFEETARKARYDFFAEIKKEHNADYISTAHHLNDSIETVFLNLTRGSGLGGLTGIQSRQEFLRPLLSLTKAEILKYLKKNRIRYVIDPTNKKNNYGRNLIRNKVVPELKKINPNLEQTMSSHMTQMKEIKDFLDNASRHWLAKQAVPSPLPLQINPTKFPIPPFTELHSAFQKHILGFIYAYLTKTSTGMTSKQIENTLCIILKNKNLKGKLGNIEFKTEYGACIFTFKNSKKKSSAKKTFNFKIEILTSLPKTKTTGIHLDLEKLDPHFNSAHLTARAWLPGDKFQPLGMKTGTKKLQDFFTDKKIPLEKRTTIPIFLYRGEIVAVGDLTVAEKYKISQTTKKTLQIS